MLKIYESDASKDDNSANDNGEHIFRCQFWRIDDSHFGNIRKHSYSIQEQWPSFQLMRSNASSESDDSDSFNLSEYYAAMCFAFGQSGNYYDDWKGAFSFPFEVNVFKGQQIFRYGLNVINWRNGVELHFYKVLDTDFKSSDLDVYRQPIESEFSAREMMVLDNFLCGYILSVKMFFKHIAIPNYFKAIGSNLITFGHVDGVFFEHQHETEEAFTAEMNKYKYLDTRQNTANQWPEQKATNAVNVEVKLDPVVPRGAQGIA